MKETKADKLYNHKKSYEKAYPNIKGWDCSKKNKELIKEYMEYCEAKSMSYSRGNRLLQHLKAISELARIDFNKATKKDLIDLVAKIRKNTYKRNGKVREY